MMEKDLTVIVVGGSSGALSSLQVVLEHLPADLSAAVLIVLHLAQGAEVAPLGLFSKSALPVRLAVDGEKLQPGVALLAVTGYHLMLRDGHVWLHRGPKENRHRPAIDPLFRSAAKFYGSRAVGVLLSGQMDDGVAGLIRIQNRGGQTIVQNPTDAAYPFLPQAALRQFVPDKVLAATDMAASLTSMTTLGNGIQNGNSAACEPFLDVQGTGTPPAPESHPEPFTCPTCHGNMWKLNEGSQDMYRCRIGHIFSTESLLSAIDQQVESSLWVAVRNLEEAASVSRRLAWKTGEQGLPGASATHRGREEELLAHALVIRKHIEESQGIT